MAQIRRETFNESVHAVKTLFQTGRRVQESELNETQDNLRVQVYRGLKFACGDGAAGTPFQSLRFSVGGTNTFTLHGGPVVIDGYEYDLPDLTVTGLTTPVGSRTDAVYLEVTEVEIADPSPDPGIGETSRRRQVEIVLKVEEGGAMPASSGDPFTGGTYRFQTGVLNRTAGVGTISAGMYVVQFLLLPRATLDVIVDTVNGLPERIHPGTSGIVDDTLSGGSLRLRDVIIAAGTSPDGIDVSDNGVTPQLWGLGGAADTLHADYEVNDSPDGVVMLSSIIRRLNGRPFWTLGDGVKTFGDINGIAALEGFLNEMANRYSSVPITLVVKPGTYTRSASVLQVQNPIRIIGEGEVQTGGGTNNAKFVGTGANAIFEFYDRVEIENVMFSSTLAIYSEASIQMRNCHITGQVLLRNVNGTDPIPGALLHRCDLLVPANNQACVRIEATTPGSFGPYVLDSCRLDANGWSTTTIHFEGYNGAAIHEALILRNCDIKTGITPSATSYRGILGFHDTATATVFLESWVMEDCRVATAGTGTSYALRLRVGIANSDDTTKNESYLKSVSIRRCKFSLKQDNATYEFFRLELADDAVSTTNDSVSVWVLENNVWDLGGFSYGQDPAGSVVSAGVHLKGCEIAFRDNRVINVVATNLAPAVTTLPFAVVAVRAHAKTRPEGKAGGSFVIDGLGVHEVSIGAGTGTKPTMVLFVTSERDSFLRRFSWDDRSLASTPFSGSGGTITLGTNALSAYVVIEQCSLFEKYAVDVIQGVSIPTGHVTVRNCDLTGGTTNTVHLSLTAGDVSVEGCTVTVASGVTANYGINAVAAGGSVLVSRCHVGAAGTTYANNGITVDGIDVHVTDCFAGGADNAGNKVQIYFGNGTPGIRHCRGNTAVDAGNAKAKIEFDTSGGGSTGYGFETDWTGGVTNAVAMIFNHATLKTP